MCASGISRGRNRRTRRSGWTQTRHSAPPRSSSRDPARRVLRMSKRELPVAEIPVPAKHPDGRYYDGARRRWIMPDGGEIPAGDASDSAP